MQRTLLSHALLVVVLCLVAGAAIAGDCKPIRAHAGTATYFAACDYDGTTYEGCIEVPIRGTLNGTWIFYYTLNNSVDLPELPEDPWPGAGSSGWGLGVSKTNKGKVFAQEAWVSHWDLAPPVVDYYIFSGNSLITGGTRHWKGATGWLGFVGDEANGGVIRGEICTP
jgi:hypothetical protein